MVLNRTVLIASLLLVSAGCTKRLPPQRLADRAALAVVALVDPESRGTTEEAPDLLIDRLNETLASRNLEVARQPLAALRGQTLSGERAKALVRGAQTPWTLLVETRAVFFSRIEGQYRWTVGVRISAARTADGASAVEEFTLPALLQYDHQKEAAAVEAVSDEIARRVALIFDGLIAAPAAAVPAPAATLRPRSIYFVMVDRFANGDRRNDVDVDLADPQAFHGGDLQGVAQHLEWLETLGVDAVWLSPVFQMRHAKYGPWGGYHGYWVEDLRRIEPGFGGEPALRAVAAGLHARGMKLLLDVVLNHAAPDGTLVKTKPDWFHHRGGIQNFDDPDQLVNGDVHGLPDFAQENPEVHAYLLSSALKWLGPGLGDGLRLDAVKHVPKTFWRAFDAEVKAAAGQGVFLVGEELEGDPAKLSAAWREGGFDAVFDFPFAFALNDVFCKQAGPERLAAILASDRLYPDPSALVTLLDNHDLPRVMSSCGGDAAKVKAALTALLTARGIPSLQQGTEVGQSGEKEPFNRADMKFEKGALYAHVKALLAARRAHPALNAGAVAVLEAGSRFVALLRVAPTERAVIAVNGGKEGRAVSLPGTGWADALDGSKLEGRPTVAPGEVRVWTAEGNFSDEARAADAQWRTGAVKRKVVFAVPQGAKITGSGPELGAWQPASAVTQAELPVGSVFEFKVVRGAEWEHGDNRVLFVAQGEGPLAVKVD